jgi:hypothetical protein
MKSARSARCLEAIPAHHFKGALLQRRAVRREKNARIPFGDLKGGEEKPLEIILHLESFPAMRPREGRWIEDDHVELFALPRQTGQDRQNIVRQKTVVVCRQRIQREIFPAARE